MGKFGCIMINEKSQKMFAQNATHILLYSFDQDAKYTISKIKVQKTFQTLPAPFIYMFHYQTQNELMVQTFQFKVECFNSETL